MAMTSVKKGHSDNNFITTIVALVEVTALGTSAVFDLHLRNIYPMNSKAKISTVIVGATSSVPEALQSVENVFHIFEDPVIQTYSNYFWPNINVQFIEKNIAKYSTKDKYSLLNF